MKLGFSANHIWHGSSVVEVAKLAEDVGFESMWMGEHIIIPVEIANPDRHGVQLPENYRHMPDPFVWLTAAAVATRNLNLGFNICLVPQRDPLVLAKTVASLDQISQGRVLFGVGAGWIHEEADIMGVPIKRRWAKTIEHVRALKTLWTEEQPSFEGEFVSFPKVYSYPKPFRRPHPPVLIGAGDHNTDNARVLQRVVEDGDGWLPVFLSPQQMREELGRLRELCDEHGRDYDVLDISLLVPAINLGVGERPSFFGDHAADPHEARDLIAEYEDAGVQRILVGLVDMTRDGGLKTVEEAAKGLGLI